MGSRRISSADPRCPLTREAKTTSLKRVRRFSKPRRDNLGSGKSSDPCRCSMGYRLLRLLHEATAHGRLQLAHSGQMRLRFRAGTSGSDSSGRIAASSSSDSARIGMCNRRQRTWIQCSWGDDRQRPLSISSLTRCLFLAIPQSQSSYHLQPFV